jgi:hypothetical protein
MPDGLSADRIVERMAQARTRQTPDQTDMERSSLDLCWSSGA